MPITLTNLQVSGPVYVPLASGVSIRLSPGQTSPELPDVEVEGSARIARLAAQGVLDVRTGQPAKATAAAKKAAAKKVSAESAESAAKQGA